MKLNPNRAIPAETEDETFKRLKRAPYSEVADLFFRQFGFNPTSSEEFNRQLEERGWTYDDFSTELWKNLNGPGTKSFTDGDETIVFTVTQLKSS